MFRRFKLLKLIYPESFKVEVEKFSNLHEKKRRFILWFTGPEKTQLRIGRKLQKKVLHERLVFLPIAFMIFEFVYHSGMPFYCSWRDRPGAEYEMSCFYTHESVFRVGVGNVWRESSPAIVSILSTSCQLGFYFVSFIHNKLIVAGKVLLTCHHGRKVLCDLYSDNNPLQNKMI